MRRLALCVDSERQEREVGHGEEAGHAAPQRYSELNSERGVAEELKRESPDEPGNRWMTRGKERHSHVEDGLLVPHHVSVSHRQCVVATLQVKVLERQLDHLEMEKSREGTSLPWQP